MLIHVETRGFTTNGLLFTSYVSGGEGAVFEAPSNTKATANAMSAVAFLFALSPVSSLRGRRSVTQGKLVPCALTLSRSDG